jgi:hypothetical protein
MTTIRTVPDCEHDEIDWSCRSCRARRARDDYQENSDRYKSAAKRRVADLRERVNQIKSVPCADCGGRFDPVCMDFDHLPEYEKVADIASMFRRKFAWSKIEAEIAKCDVVCANCHRLRTKARGRRLDSDF